MSVRNFGRYLLKERRRVEMAKLQLEATSTTIKQICSDCGFGSAESMRLSFLRHVNTTPARYREQFRFDRPS